MAIPIFYYFWLRIAARACDLVLALRALAEVGDIYTRKRKGSGRVRALLCTVFPDAKGIFVYAVRTPAAGFSSESENIGIEVSAVCAFIIGGADLGHDLAAHTKASQVI